MGLLVSNDLIKKIPHRVPSSSIPDTDNLGCILDGSKQSKESGAERRCALDSGGSQSSHGDMDSLQRTRREAAFQKKPHGPTFVVKLF